MVEGGYNEAREKFPGNMSHGQLSTLPVSDTLRLLASLLSG